MSRAAAPVGRLLVAAVLAGCAAVPAACAAGAPAGRPAGGGEKVGAVVASLRDEGVAVTFGWSSPVGAHPVLAVRFTPQPGFHLYSVDLPPDGVRGVGRPTRVEVGGALAADGRPRPDARALPLHIDGLDAALPVYPDGPVTLRQAVRVTPGGRARAWVTYAACSGSTCLPPVIRREVALALPGTP